MDFASPIEALLQGYANMDCLHRQQLFLGKPLSTRQKELMVKAMERILPQVSIKIVWLMGIPPLVCPPPPSDTPPPMFISFSSIKTFVILNQELQKPRAITRKHTTTSISSWVFQKWIILFTSPKWLSSTATQKSNPPSQITLNFFTQMRGNCIRQDPDETTRDDSVKLLIPIRFCYMTIILNYWTTSLPTYTCGCEFYGKIIDGDIIIEHRCIKNGSTRFDTCSSHGSTLRGTGGTIENMSKESKGTMVKMDGVIIEGTKAVYCQWDKAIKRSDNILPKLYLEMGEVYLLCLLNKCFKFLSLSLVLVSLNSFSCVVSTYVLVIMSGNMSTIACNIYYENLVLGDDIECGRTTSHYAGLRSIRLRKRFYISLLPQQSVHIPSSASAPSEPFLHDCSLRRVLSLPTRDDDCEEIGFGYLRRVLCLPTRDGKVLDLLRSKNYGLLSWVVFQEALIVLAFAFYHSKCRVFYHISNKQLITKSRRSRIRHTTRQSHITNKLEKLIIALSNMFLCRLYKLSTGKPRKISKQNADITRPQSSLPQSLPLRLLGDKTHCDIPNM